MSRFGNFTAGSLRSILIWILEDVSFKDSAWYLAESQHRDIRNGPFAGKPALGPERSRVTSQECQSKISSLPLLPLCFFLIHCRYVHEGEGPTCIILRDCPHLDSRLNLLHSDPSYILHRACALHLLVVSFGPRSRHNTTLHLISNSPFQPCCETQL